jgi:hypothetical protein
LHALVKLEVSVLGSLDHPVGSLLVLVGPVDSLFHIFGGVNQWLDLLQHSVLHFKHLELIFSFLEDLANTLESFVVLWGEESQALSISANSCRSTASVHVDLSVPWALVVEHVGNIWNIKTSSRDICAHQNGLGIDSSFDLVDSPLELLKVLESLPLLHFGVETIILDFQKVQKTIEPPCGCDSVAEYDHRLSSLLLEVVIEVEVLLVIAASYHLLSQGCWHFTGICLLGQIDDLGVLRSEPQGFTEGVKGALLIFLLSLTLLHNFGLSRRNSTLIINGHGG